MQILRATPAAGNIEPRCEGRVLGTRGPLVQATIPLPAIGNCCCIERTDGSAMLAEIVAFHGEVAMLAPYDELCGIIPGARVTHETKPLEIAFAHDPRGWVLDACGRPLRALAPSATAPRRIAMRSEAPPPPALDRLPLTVPFETGVRSIDTLLTVARGQRVGIFAAAGVGKSTLLGMIARNAAADVRVIALVGERGREVPGFINEIGAADSAHSTIIVTSTADESPARRILAPKTATAIAEYYRAQGKHVLLLVDSLTRTARALREVGLAMGEIPVRQGYTPSVYTELPKLLERAGTDARGSITAFYTVLLGGEEETDALGEELKSLLDGHIVLSSAAASQGIRPAIDISVSGSRLFSALHDADYRAKRDLVCRMMHRLKKDKDLLLLGGSPDAELACALLHEPALQQFLTQQPDDRISADAGARALDALYAQLGGAG